VRWCYSVGTRGWSGRNAAVAVAIPTAWIVALYVSKIAIWRFTQGQAIWFNYGADKSLSNFVLESAIVALLVSFYLAIRATAEWSSKAFAACHASRAGGLSRTTRAPLGEYVLPLLPAPNSPLHLSRRR
jgi:hypothetical protein